MAGDAHTSADPFQAVLDLDIPKVYAGNNKSSWMSGSGKTEAAVTGTGQSSSASPAATNTSTRTTTTKVAGKPDKVTQTTTSSPQKGKGVQQPIGEIGYDKDGLAYNVDKKFFDYKNTQNASVEAALDAEGSENQRMLYGAIDKAEPSLNIKHIEHIKEQVSKYNAQRGFTPLSKDEQGNPVFSKEQVKAGAIDIKDKFPLKDKDHPEAGYRISMMPDEFAALSSLASEDNYVSESRTLNPELNKELLERKKPSV